MHIFVRILKHLDFNLILLALELNLITLPIRQFRDELVAGLCFPPFDFGIKNRLPLLSPLHVRAL
ncbi:MAG: hypothetical protein ABSE40_02735 [Candidatus Sulfotelmatobacter sp.]|jgi:hypothetical protein